MHIAKQLKRCTIPRDEYNHVFATENIYIYIYMYTHMCLIYTGSRVMTCSIGRHLPYDLKMC